MVSSHLYKKYLNNTFDYESINLFNILEAAKEKFISGRDTLNFHPKFNFFEMKELHFDDIIRLVEYDLVNRTEIPLTLKVDENKLIDTVIYEDMIKFDYDIDGENHYRIILVDNEYNFYGLVIKKSPDNSPTIFEDIPGYIPPALNRPLPSVPSYSHATTKSMARHSPMRALPLNDLPRAPAQTRRLHMRYTSPRASAKTRGQHTRPQDHPRAQEAKMRTPRTSSFSLNKLSEAEANDDLFAVKQSLGGKKTRKRKGIIRGKKYIKSKKSRKRKKIRKSYKNKRIIKRH